MQCSLRPESGTCTAAKATGPQTCGVGALPRCRYQQRPAVRQGAGALARTGRGVAQPLVGRRRGDLAGAARDPLRSRFCRRQARLEANVAATNLLMVVGGDQNNLAGLHPALTNTMSAHSRYCGDTFDVHARYSDAPDGDVTVSPVVLEFLGVVCPVAVPRMLLAADAGV